MHTDDAVSVVEPDDVNPDSLRSDRFAGRTALVTGSTRGIGRAIALALAAAGARVHVTGTDQAALDGLRVEPVAGQLLPIRADLGKPADLEYLATSVQADAGQLHILVHSAGHLRSGSLADTPVEALDELQAVNVRAPYVLTRALLPLLVANRGDLVFINSSLGVQARGGASQYSASKHALRALADSFREEINAQGVRVLSLYLGRTATSMQAAVHAAEGRAYNPERLLQPESVAESLLAALALPETAEVTDLYLRPRHKSP